MALGKIISTVGAVVSNSAQNLRVLSINPTIIGNLFFLEAAVESVTTTTMPTAVTGGNCVGLSGSGGWTLLTSVRGPGSGGNLQMSFWAGVATATGAQNLTITSTANSTTWVDLSAQQLTCVGASALTVWSTDGSPASLINSTAATTTIWPSFTPGNVNSAYIGFVWVNGGAPNTTGQTSGYTMALDTNSNGVFYNVNVSGTQTPTSTTPTAKQTTTMASLLTAINPVTSAFMPFFGMGHHEDELERRSSGLYVQRRKLAGIRPNGGKDRVLARV